MAYKFQLGSFTASGSIKVEDTLDAASTLQIGGVGVTATAAEINLIDGGTARGTTAVASGDGFLHNDAGTMRMTSVDKMADLFAGNALSASSGVLSVKADDASLEINSDALRVKEGGVTNAMLAGSIANAKLSNSAITLNPGAGLGALGSVSLGGSISIAVDGVLEDLDTLGAPSADGEFLVATGAGAFAYESGATARTSIGLGTGDNAQFNAVIIADDAAFGAVGDTDMLTMDAGSDITVAADLDFVIGKAGGLTLADGAVQSTAAELNLLDGAGAGSVVNNKAVIYNGGGVVIGQSLATADDGHLGNQTTPQMIQMKATRVEFNQAVVFNDDIFVSGSTVTMDQQHLVIQDKLIGLGFVSGSVTDDNVSAPGDRGFIFGMHGEDNVAMHWDEGSSRFKFIKTDSLPTATTVNEVSKADLEVGVLHASSVVAPLSLSIDAQAQDAINLSSAAGKVVYVTGTLAASRSTTLPAAPNVGDQIDVKLAATGGNSLTIEKGADGHNIDGGDSIILESDFAAVKLVYVAANTWRVF
tara:strand:- start:3820 stop:5415 length:1596 start_codon:yes stop_codon:yes gene_type:complete